MEAMGGIRHNTICFAEVSCKENIQDGGERGTDDLCSCVHCLLEGLVVCCTTVPVPDSDAAGQHALNGSPVESCDDGWMETHSTYSFLMDLFVTWRPRGCHQNRNPKG